MEERYYSESLLHNLAYHDDVNGNCNGMIDFTVIDSISGADVEPVRHGRWIEKRRGAKSPEGYYYWNTPLTHVFVCSKCGRQEDKKEPYCHCGAKMDGKDCEEV